MKNKRTTLLRSAIALLLCVSMLVGTTFAWFTDSVSTGINTIAAGNLDVELYHSNAAVTDERVDSATKLFMDLQGEPILWEPGVVSYENLRVANEGDLALACQLALNTANENFVVDGNNLYGLSQILKVGFVEGGITATDRAGVVASVADANWTTLADFLRNGSLLADGEQTWGVVVYWQPGENDNLWNLNNGKHLNQGDTLSIDLGIKLIATQEVYENDSFGNDYDATAKQDVFPDFVGGSASVTVVPDAQNRTSSDASMSAGKIQAFVPAGVQLAAGATELKLNVSNMSATGSNVVLDDHEAMRSLDVHIEGVDPSNTAPITVTLEEIAPVGLNMGNYKLYHVENGSTVEMTLVGLADPFTAHNQFKYDPATGDITLYMATFSEVAMVAEPAKWEGNFDYSWYTNAVAPADGEAVTEYVIANADQLWSLSQIVGGMAKDESGNYIYTATDSNGNEYHNDSFKGKTIKLIVDINLADDEKNNDDGKIFYPIGYYNSEETYEKSGEEITSGLRNFEGTFDGNGHTVSNFYQNTWEMKGDHDWYSPEEQYYRDGMGLFGRVYKGTVKNLTIKNFSSDGEIATTGCVAAYADGATFENIAIFDCNPRVYNIGNGGIVGCVGWYAKEENLKTTFTNITVDNSNKISALWGSYDVACGGIVGQYYPTSGQTSANKPANGGIDFVNCHVAAQMDVYNDVCANYQYYAYRYAGMLIGSVRENVTIDGHVYPKMDGITAKDCTVHFGTWNDYYYCEIIDNTTASYTHDYQMSRLTEIKAIDGTTITYLDGTTGTVPASGRANYVIVDYTEGHGTENATCYHFKDGAVWTHDMGGIQTGIDENGDGQDDLKEDKQHIYLEFNNLVTGYGWGVTTKSVGDLAGVTILDREVANSVEKFEGKVTELANNVAHNLGDIFNFVNNGVKLVPGALAVSVTNLDENNPVSATVVYDRTNWANSTLTLKGTGEVQITIQDYYFCTPTTIEVNVTEREAEEKFEKLFTGSFLYRVGNQNAVKLGSLFKAKDGVTIGNVDVTIEKVAGSASGTYTSNATWTDGEIQFSGNGTVKVTITDNAYCTPTELTLEVVDAVNAITATSAKANNVVLLNNCWFSSLEVSNGYTLYGNGFTMTCGSDSAALDMGYSFVTLNNGTLDNVQIVCPNFDYAVLYKSNMTESGNRSETTDKTRYFNVKSGVMVSGNSQILNSRISGGRAAVNVSSGNVVIDNSRIELGAVASILVGAANSLTLRDVTLVQKPTASTYDSSKTLLGFSVLVMCNSEGYPAPIVLEGKLVQNAWASEADAKYVPSSGASVVTQALGKEYFLHDLDGDGTRESLNLGIAYMPEEANQKVDAAKVKNTITDDRDNIDEVPYDGVELSVGLGSAYVYSYKNSNGTDTDIATENTYAPNAYGDIIAVSYNDATDGLTAGKSYDAVGWVYELNVDLDKVSGYKLDFSKLSITINGTTITDFKVNNGAKPASPVAVTAGGTTYTLTATVNGKKYDVYYRVTGTETSKESPSLVSANYVAGLCVASSYGGTWHGAAPALEGIQIKYWSVAEKQYKTIKLSDYTPTTKGQLNGVNTTWTYSPANGDFTLTLTGGQVHSSNNVYAMPVVCENVLYFVAASSKGLVNSGNSARTIPVTYTFKDNNNGDVLTFSHTWSVAENKNAQYKYSDFCKGTLTKLENCITPDTLITLADGSQKRIDHVTAKDKILAWDFFTGTYVEKNISLLVNHGEDVYRVANLEFSDGTVLRLIGNHGVFDYDLNKFVYFTVDNMHEYIGHRFVQHAADGEYRIVTLTDAYETEEYTSAWSITSADSSNAFASGMLTVAPPEDFYNWVAMDGKLHYDVDQFQKDVETYGLYTYDDFKDYVTYEQFVDWNGAYLKIPVEKGYFTFEYILELIELYKGWMPNN